MKGFLNNRRVSCTLSALCFIALGVFLVFWPELSRIWICRLLGAALLVSGGVYVVSHFARAKGAAAVFQYDLILGAVLAVVGVAAYHAGFDCGLSAVYSGPDPDRPWCD